MLAIEKRLSELSPQLLVLSSALSALMKPIIGDIESSLERYIPKPAGLIPIAERSPPSEVKAPAIAIERAVPKPKLVCERVYISLDIIPSRSISRPPKRYCACAADNAPTAIATARSEERIILENFISAHFCEGVYPSFLIYLTSARAAAT